MNKTIFLVGCFLTLLSCNEIDKSTNQVHNNNHSQTLTHKNKDSTDILDSIDVVSLKENYTKGTIQLYNQDGSIWKTFEVTDNYSDDSIIPFAIKPENSILVFKVVGRKDNYYSIIVNEEKSTIKLIKYNVPYFNYETWQQHILKVFSIDFIPKQNPLKVDTFNNAKNLSYDKEQFYHPIQINGDWLKVKDDNNKEGWIKWRNSNGKLQIQIFYDA